jgi:hypothetical protein
MTLKLQNLANSGQDIGSQTLKNGAFSSIKAIHEEDKPFQGWPTNEVF